MVEWSAFQASPDAVLLCLGRDVTAQRPAARLVQERDAFYRAVAEHGFDIMALLSAEGLYTYMGGSVQKALGYRPEEMVGHSPFEFIHPDDVVAAQAASALRQEELRYGLSDGGADKLFSHLQQQAIGHAADVRRKLNLG